MFNWSEFTISLNKVVKSVLGIALITSFDGLSSAKHFQKITSKQCPETLNEWLTWRNEALKNSMGFLFTSGLTKIQFKLLECKSHLENLEQGHCFQNLVRFSEQEYRSNKRTHTLGLEISDENYFREMSELGLGSLPKQFLSNDFLHDLDNPSDPDFSNVMERIKKINTTRETKVIAFPYRSRHLPSVDDAKTKDRFFLFIPSKNIDIFAQFGVGSTVENKLPNSISVISILKAKEDEVFVRAKVYYNDLWRIRKEGTFEIKNRIQVNGRMELCYSCHKSPLIPIFPNRDRFNFEKYGLSLSKINNLMSQYSDGVTVGISAKHFGPPMGITRELTNSDIKKCAQIEDGETFSESEYDQVRTGTRCHGCHNGLQRGALNFPSGLSTQLEGGKSLAELFVYHYRIMPPGPFEADKVSLAIFRCITDDYYGDFVSINRGKLNSWLTNDTCFSSSGDSEDKKN